MYFFIEQQTIHPDTTCVENYYKIKKKLILQDFLDTDENKGAEEDNSSSIDNDLMSFETYVSPNDFNAKCGVCSLVVLPKSGLVLTECLHTFHSQCIADYVENNISDNIVCPFKIMPDKCSRGLLVSYTFLMNTTNAKNSRVLTFRFFQSSTIQDR